MNNNKNTADDSLNVVICFEKKQTTTTTTTTTKSKQVGHLGTRVIDTWITRGSIQPITGEWLSTA